MDIQFSDWLIAFVPIFTFGLIPVIGTLIGGSSVEQSMGIALGAFIFAIIIFFIKLPEITPFIFLISFISGVCWAIGSIGQFEGVKLLGVSRSTPIMNGGQIISTSLVGISLGDWASRDAKTFGFIALALIIAGILFTSYKKPGFDSFKPQWGKGIIMNLIAVGSFTAYVGVLKYYQIDSWSTILPQSIGMTLGVLLIGMFILHTKTLSKLSFRNSLVGIIFGIGNLALLISQLKLGLATAYPVSQASVIVAIFGGVIINKERKSGRGWVMTGIGITIILSGLFMIYLAGEK